MEQQVEAITEDSNMVRRLTIDLVRCHQESLKLIKVLINVADALGQRGENNHGTIRNLKKWAVEQLKVQQKSALE